MVMKYLKCLFGDELPNYRKYKLYKMLGTFNYQIDCDARVWQQQMLMQLFVSFLLMESTTTMQDYYSQQRPINVSSKLGIAPTTLLCCQQRNAGPSGIIIG